MTDPEQDRDIQSLPQPVKTSSGNINPNGFSQRSIVYRVLVGLLLTVCIAFSWAGQTQFTKSAYANETTFNAPLFLVWFSTNWMVLCYPIFLTGFLASKFLACNNTESSQEKAPIRRKVTLDLAVFGSFDHGIRKFLIIGTARLLFFTVLWILCNYAASQALRLILPAEFTVIFSCNSAIVFVLSFVVLREPFTTAKVVSLILCIAGVVCVSYAEGLSHFGALGVVCSIVSAFLAAVYKVGFKRIVGDADLGQVSLFMTCLGLCNLVLFWIPTVALLETNTEIMHRETAPWKFIVGSSILGFIFNLMINIGIAVTYPLFVSIGMFVGIPLNTLIDFLARGRVYGTLKIVGIVLIVISFLVILIPWEDLVKKKRRDEYNVVQEGVDSEI